jgi:hypothetical protein
MDGITTSMESKMENLANGLYHLLYTSEVVSDMDGFCGMYPLGLIQRGTDSLILPFQNRTSSRRSLRRTPLSHRV